jgi:alpha-tubulin suppressor-like RCC1 family protein
VRARVLATMVGLLGACGGGDAPAPADDEAAPPEPSLPTLCAGRAHACAVEEDGRLLCWGRNLEGQLADGGRQNRDRPTRTVLEDVRGVACGDDHGCALLRDGGVRCWGNNESGQLGVGDTAIHLDPVTVELADVEAIHAGERFTCTRHADGSVRCWGEGRDGRLGQADAGDRWTPTVVRGLEGVRDLALGEAFACAVVEGGAVRCWGDDGEGQLGRGPEGGGTAPVQGLTGVRQVAAGRDFACATTDRETSCWGSHREGQLGIGPEAGERSSTPRRLDGLGGARALAAGEAHACAIAPREEGDASPRLFCWGRGSATGTPQRGAVDRPRAVDALATEVAAGGSHTVLRAADGAIQAFGTSDEGALGSGRASQPVPGPVAETLAPEAPVASEAAEPTPNVQALAAGRAYQCALAAGRVRCFGLGIHGQLGNGDTRTVGADAATPVAGLVDAVDVDGRWTATCAVRARGDVLCWGHLPVPGPPATSLPRAMEGVRDATQVAVGETVICALRQTGEVACLGRGGAGQLGRGSFEASPTFVAVEGVDDAVQVEAGARTVCARRRGGGVVCWGEGDGGRLGTGTEEGALRPTAVRGIEDAVDLAVDAGGACVARARGDAACWGLNDTGQLGDPRFDGAFSALPVEVLRLRDVRTVHRGDGVACARMEGGRTRCWGANDRGQTGHGDEGDERRAVVRGAWDVRPADEALGPIEDLSIGRGFACARHGGGELSCWGRPPLRPGVPTELRRPTAVGGLGFP